MDALDLHLFQLVTRQRIMWWAASDPRVSARGVAQELGVDRGTVSARLKRWVDDGFLIGRQFLPNPGLFGESYSACRVRLESTHEKPGFLADLADHEGIVAALDSTGPEIVTIMSHGNPSELERRRRMLSRHPSVDDLGPPGHFPTPPARHQATSSDWTLLQNLRDDPTGKPETIAKKLGVSTRTIRRRHKTLLESGIAWCITQFDFTRHRGTIGGALLASVDGAPPAQVAEALKQALPPHVEYPSLQALVWDHPGPIVQLFVPLPSSAAAEEVERKALAVDGVVAARMTFPHRLHFYDAWADERLDRATSGRNASGAARMLPTEAQ